MIELCCEYYICTVHLTVSSYRVTYAFQTESRIYICLNVKELLAPNRRDIWNLTHCNEIRTHSQLVRKRTLNHLVKLIKWLSWVVSTCLYGAFDCTFLLCHIRDSEWIHALYLPEYQRNPCSKQAQYLKFKLLQRDSNPQPLSSYTNTQSFSQINQMTKLSYEYFSLLCIWLYLIFMSRTRFRVNSGSIFFWMSRNSFLVTCAISEL